MSIFTVPEVTDGVHRKVFTVSMLAESEMP